MTENVMSNPMGGLDERTPRVLLVEDYHEIADIYSEWLTPTYSVEVANSCAEAFERFNQRIDVVVLNRDLPDGTGSELLAEIRASDLDCCVGMVTAEELSIGDILDLRFDAYLNKPISQAELVETVDRLCQVAKFNETIREAHEVATKLSVLERRLSGAELAEYREYGLLLERQKELCQSLSTVLGVFERLDDVNPPKV